MMAVVVTQLAQMLAQARSAHNISSTALLYRHWRYLGSSDNSPVDAAIFCVRRIQNGCMTGNREVLKSFFLKFLLQ